MNPLSALPAPLSHAQFYMLLGLARGDSHGYPLQAVAQNDSLGSVKMDEGNLYRYIKKMHDQGFIDLVSVEYATNSGKPSRTYAISPHGLIRLKEECLRLRHAVKIAEHAHLFEDTTPTDIQRLLLGL